MVPLADMFNHKTRGEHVHFTSEGQVCEYCGEIDGCGCGSENDEGDDADEPNPNGEDAPEEIIDTSDADNDGHMPGPQMLEMVIVNACPANAEVFNTYGELSNASLLNRYGFIEENNPFSLVEVTREDIFKQIDKPLLESEETSDRIGFWDQVGRNIVEKIEDDISLDGDDEEDCGEDDDETCCVEGTCDHEDDPEEQSDMFDEDGSQDEEEETDDNFQIEATGCPNFHLRAFLTLIHMPHSEFEAICHDLEKVIQALTHISNSPWNPKTKKGKAKSGLQSLIANSVLKIASSRLSEYPSRVEDDFEKLKTVKDERSRHAINLCIEEKTILAKCIEISS